MIGILKGRGKFGGMEVSVGRRVETSATAYVFVNSASPFRPLRKRSEDVHPLNGQLRKQPW